MFKRFDRHYFDLLWAMTWKELTVRYKQAVFGFLWVILNPLLQMVIMGIVFSNFVKIPNYFIFLFSGLLPWQFFSLTLAKVTTCFINERSLLQKAVFCREIIPLSFVLSNAINMFLSLGLFVIALQFLTPATHTNFLSFFLSVAWLIVFTTGLSLCTSSLNVKFRDVSFIVQTITLLWFYATPILYSTGQLPTILQKLLIYNPLSAPISLLQSSLLGTLSPSIEMTITSIGVTIFVFCTGTFIFIKESPYFVDWL